MLAKTYLLIALPLVLSSALFVPPNQVPDEMTHLLRADQLAHGSIQGIRMNDASAGGEVDAGVAAFVRQHAAWAAPPPHAPPIPFSGTLEYAHFPNTVRYPPVLYVPSVLALWLGRAVDCSVATAFYAARLANAAVAVLLCAGALGLARRGGWLLLTLGLMPMALFEMGSVCQDAGLLGVSLLLAAGMTRLPCASPRAYWAVAGLIAIMGGARPPLLALVLLLGLRGWRGVFWPHRLAAPLGCVVAVLSWSASTASLQVAMRADVPASVAPQLMHLVHHPSAVGPILFNTLCRPDTNWLKTFIGVLGWLTVHLSASGYVAGVLALGLAALLCARQPNPLGRGDRAWVVAAAAAAFAGILLTTYLTWTPLGAVRVEGMQGRYFYGFLPLAVVALPVWRPKPRRAWPAPWVGAALLIGCLLWLLQDAVGATYQAWSRHAPWPQPPGAQSARVEGQFTGAAK